MVRNVYGNDFLYIVNGRGLHKVFFERRDRDRLMCLRWNVKPTTNRNRTLYARAQLSGKWILMHRYVLSFPSLIIDHVNSNGLDNRRSNLLLSSHSENNRGVLKKKGRGVFPGVSLRGSTYRVKLSIGEGREIGIGNFKTLREAVYARRRSERLYL